MRNAYRCATPYHAIRITLRRHAQRYLVNHTKRIAAADEEAFEVIAGHVLHRVAAEVDGGAVRQRRPQGQQAAAGGAADAAEAVRAGDGPADAAYVAMVRWQRWLKAVFDECPG